jgi:hypothetical protein
LILFFWPDSSGNPFIRFSGKKIVAKKEIALNKSHPRASFKFQSERHSLISIL